MSLTVAVQMPAEPQKGKTRDREDDIRRDIVACVPAGQHGQRYHNEAREKNAMLVVLSE
jgi:hypothetical protein